MHYKDLIGSSEYEECHKGDEGAFWVDLPPMLQEEYPSDSSTAVRPCTRRGVKV